MPPDQLTSQTSNSTNNLSHQNKTALVIIIVSAVFSLAFLGGSILQPALFFSSWVSYLLVFIPPVLAFAVYFISKKPLEEDDILIAKLKQANLQLASQSGLFQAILQSIKEGMIITNTKGIISFANKKIAEILQIDPTTLVEQPLTKFLNNDQLATSSLSDFLLQIDNALGKKITLKIDSFPLISDGQKQGTIYIITDVTSESELEKLKLDFVAQAAHQLRTPLTILKSYLSVLSDSISSKISPDDKVNLDRSIVGANQLALLIENLLNVSKIEGGKLDLHPQLASIEQIISFAIGKNNDNAAQKGVKIYFQQASGPLPQVIIDPTLIEQAISNLLANAVENSHKDGPVIVSVSLQNNSVIVSVTDQGIGIPSEATSKLFTKFYKVSGNLIQASKGIGLGLYDTKAIIEAHGGTISVNSLLNKGSTFWFTLPIRQG